MTENYQLLSAHKPTGSRTVLVEHILEGFPKELQIFLTKSCLSGKIGRDKPMAHIEAIRHCRLTTHCLLLFQILLFGNGHSRNGMLHRVDRINRTGKSQLHRSAKLVLFSCCSDYCSKSTYIIIGLRKIILGCQFFIILALHFRLLVSIFYYNIKHSLITDKDIISAYSGFCSLNIVAHLALQAYIGH